MDGRVITAKEVAEDLECSMQHAYKIVRKLNEELDEMGCITMRGKTNRSSVRREALRTERRDRPERAGRQGRE